MSTTSSNIAMIGWSVNCTPLFWLNNNKQVLIRRLWPLVDIDYLVVFFFRLSLRPVKWKFWHQLTELNWTKKKERIQNIWLENVDKLAAVIFFYGSARKINTPVLNRGILIGERMCIRPLSTISWRSKNAPSKVRASDRQTKTEQVFSWSN